MTGKKVVVVIGAYPPPVHGFSEITSKMAEAIANAPGAVVHRVTRTPPFLYGRRFFLADIVKALWQICRHVCLIKLSKTTYIGLSGGAGLYIDLLHIILAKVGRNALWVHHHNYTYITKPHLAMILLNKVAGNANHIFLCQCMEFDFKKTYQLDALHGTTLSNVSFRPPKQLEYGGERVMKKALRVGFLSNITAEKGIFIYFRILEALRTHHPNITGLIAGPVDSNIAREFQGCLTRTCEYIRHAGPVYGEAKERFFESIDVLLFPSMYANEAEPVTIAESLSHSVPVIATNRGCISEIDNGAGLVGVPVVGSVSDFEAYAIEKISDLASDPEILAVQKTQVAREFLRIQKAAAKKLDEIVSAIAEGRNVAKM